MNYYVEIFIIAVLFCIVVMVYVWQYKFNKQNHDIDNMRTSMTNNIATLIVKIAIDAISKIFAHFLGF